MWTVRRQWQALIALAMVASMANLFGPAERWGGVDIGATGAAVFYLCLVALLVLMALKGSEVFPETWSLAERRAWVGLGFTALIVGAAGKFLWVFSHLEIVPTWLNDVPARNLVNFIIVMGIAWGIAARVLGRGRALSNTTSATCGCVLKPIGSATGHSASPWWPVWCCWRPFRLPASPGGCSRWCWPTCSWRC
jgi:hypothetical protein